jgi:hypothetical protein
MEAFRAPEEFIVSWEVASRVLLIHFLEDTGRLIEPCPNCHDQLTRIFYPARGSRRIAPSSANCYARQWTPAPIRSSFLFPEPTSMLLVRRRRWPTYFREDDHMFRSVFAAVTLITLHTLAKVAAAELSADINASSVWSRSLAMPAPNSTIPGISPSHSDMHRGDIKL